MNKPNIKKYMTKEISDRSLSVSMGQVLDSLEALKVLGGITMPFRLSYKIGKIIKFLNDEAVIFHEKRNKRIQELGELIKENEHGEYKVKQENKEIWEKEIQEILKNKITISVPVIKAEELEDIKVSPAVMAVVSWILE